MHDELAALSYLLIDIAPNYHMYILYYPFSAIIECKISQ